jgi:hypothetical protein
MTDVAVLVFELVRELATSEQAGLELLNISEDETRMAEVVRFLIAVTLTISVDRVTTKSSPMLITGRISCGAA